MALSIVCSSCGAKFRVPDYAFGRLHKCPKCGKSVEVAVTPNQSALVETVEPISPLREPTPPDDVPVAELAHEEDTKACPFCGETVLAVAKKCKHCHEFIDSPSPAEVLEVVPIGAKSVKPSATNGKSSERASPVAPNKKDNEDAVAVILGCGCLTIFGVLLFAICNWLFFSDRGETKETAGMIANSHEQGAEVGREEGKRAGEAGGFAASFDSAEKETYRETIDELYQSHHFQRIPLYTVGVVIGFFILGFILQWLVFYVPRRGGYLRDIDWIVLPKEMTQVDLNDLSAPLPTKSKRLKPPSAGTALLFLLTLLPLNGCKSREEEAWRQGYDANRNAAYQEGWQEGARRGEKEAKEQGKAKAEHAAQTGRAWQLYTIPAFLALMFGIIVGLALQYTVLACCNDARRVPELVTLALVPAMKHSVAYSILESRRKLLIWWEQEKSRLAAANQLKAAQVQAVHDVIVRKLKVMTTLEELTQSRLLDLAQEELAKVVSDAEQKAQTTTKRTVVCRHCGRTIAYPRKKAGKTVHCPYASCGHPIHLPANDDES